MKRNLIIVAALSLAVAMVSCKKDIEDLENTYRANVNSSGMLATMLSQAGPQQQTFTFSVSAGTSFIGTSGTKVAIPANAFLYPSQQPVVGTVTVTMIEVYNKRDMVCSGGFTTSNGLPLASGGEVEIRAYQGATELQYNTSAGPMSIMFPVTNPDPQMELFVANDIGPGQDFDRVDSSLFITTDTSWTPVPAPYYYQVYTSGLGWANCDYFYNYAGDKTGIIASLPAIFNENNTMVICVFENINIATQLYYFNSATNSFDLGTYYQVPVGELVKFVAMSDINGQLYWGEVTATIVDNHSLSLIPQPVTQAEFDQHLDNLN